MSLVLTRVQDWRVSDPTFDRNMVRMGEYGALDFFASQTKSPNSIISPELQAKAFQSMGTDVQVPVLDYNGGVTVANERSCVIADAENTSKLYTLTWVTLATGFTMVPSAYMNNEIGYQRDFNRKMATHTRALLEKLDGYAVAALEANKTQVFENLLYYTQTGNVIDVPWLMRDSILGDSAPMMRANKYFRELHVIGNSGLDAHVRHLAQMGVYNEQNKRLEYEGKILHYSGAVKNESGKFATGFVVEDGNCAIVTRVDREALRGASANGHEWDVVRLPMLDLPVGAHYYTSVGDQSGIAGDATKDLNCAIKEYYGFSVDVCFITAYNSAPSTIANPVIKFQVENSNGMANARPVVITNTPANPVHTKNA
nr:MAG TPA: major capsid protein [Caudoviricetes sp.]